MRPNIDIRWSIHGKVKEYAENNDLSVEEAYEELLEAGWETLNEDTHESGATTEQSGGDGRGE